MSYYFFLIVNITITINLVINNYTFGAEINSENKLSDEIMT